MPTRRASPNARREQVVLEIGCGASWSAARRVVHERLSVASDVDLAMVGTEKARGTVMMGADGRSLPLRTASLDTIVIKNVSGDPGLGESVASAIGVTGIVPRTMGAISSKRSSRAIPPRSAGSAPGSSRCDAA